MNVLTSSLPLLSLALAVAAQGDLERDLDAMLREKLAADRIPGISCAVVVGRELRYARGFGFSDLENEVAATPDTVYRLASISKPVTAVLALQLAEQGRLDLDADVREVVPGWPQKRWPVTTRQLLGHLGGVRHYRGEPESTQRYADQRASLGRFARSPLLHEPGTRYRYTTYGFNLVAAAVEAVHERPFAEVVKEHIAAPAGAASLQDDDQRRVIPHRAQGYVVRGAELQNSQLMDSSYKLGGGGLCSAAVDLARFAGALMGGALLKEETLALMWTSQRTADGEETGYGMGFSVKQLEGELEVGHSGAQARVSTMMLMLPGKQIGVVVMCNLEQVKLAGVARRALRRVRDEVGK